jgi:hypothetical protein
MDRSQKAGGLCRGFLSGGHGWLSLPLVEGRMDRVNGYPIFQLGAALGVMGNRAGIGDKLTDVAQQMFAAHNTLLQFLDCAVPSLMLSKEAAKNLIQELEGILRLERVRDPNAVLTPQEAGNLNTLLQHFSSVLFAELGALDLFILSRKLAYDMPTLIKEAEKALPDSITQHLGPAVISDIREAGKCLAFDVPTAVGFHLFRAVEAAILLYFPVLNITTKPSDRNLGAYIKLLKDGGVDPKVIGMLNHLKDHYRNPLIHPELFLTFDDAASLFSFAMSAILALVNELQVQKAKLPTATAL